MLFKTIVAMMAANGLARETTSSTTLTPDSDATPTGPTKVVPCGFKPVPTKPSDSTTTTFTTFTAIPTSAFIPESSTLAKAAPVFVGGI